MGSPEIVDSCRVPVRKTSFSQTCNLLSQYLKEKGSLGELGLGLSHRGAAPIRTMDLLPMIEKSGRNSGSVDSDSDPRNGSVAGREEALKNSDISATKSETDSAQMTIFYAGQVIVLNDFPAEKANEIMSLASNHFRTYSPPKAERIPADSIANFPRFVPNFVTQNCDHRFPLGSDLPIARKNSLARFLGKRKDRIMANEPYPTRKRAITSTSEAWLGLATQFSS